MPTTSQFTCYTNFDVGAPTLNGMSGSLISVLDFCLVSGSKWEKTLNSASANVNVMSGYRAPSGSRLYLFVNDAAPGVAVGKEAWITGWEVLTNTTGSLIGATGILNPSITGSTGGGWGMFPLRHQAINQVTRTEPAVTVRKSSVADTSFRNWILYSDSYTMYMFVLSEATTIWHPWWFGDIYSFVANDSYRCTIGGRGIINSGGASSGRTRPDFITTCGADVNNADSQYMARTGGGGGFSILVGKTGDSSVNGGTANISLMSGNIPIPNPTDNAYQISTVSVIEFNGGQASTAPKPVRGRMRGFWHLCHDTATITHGIDIYGTGDYAGKIFKVIKPGAGNSGGGIFLIETSPTVETN